MTAVNRKYPAVRTLFNRRDKTGILSFGIVAMAFTVEFVRRLVDSSIPDTVSQICVLAASLLLFAPAVHLVLKRQSATLFKWTIMSGLVLITLSQFLNISATTSWFDSWPIFSRNSDWHSYARSLCQMIGLIVLFATLYFALLDTLRTEAAYRRESAFRDAIIENTAEGLCVFHVVDRFPRVLFTVWNCRLAEITGYTMEEVNQRQWYKEAFPTAALRSRVLNHMARMSAGETLTDEEWELLRRDGTQRTVSLSSTSLTSFGDSLHVLVLVRDITRRKRAEADLDYVSAHARCLLWYSDVQFRDGKYQWLITVPNADAAQHYLPFNLKPGQTYFEAFAESRNQFPDFATKLDENSSHALREGLPGFHQEYPCRAGDGEIHWIYEDASIQCIAPNRWRVISVSTDITQRKRAEEDRLKLEQRLLHSQKLESIGVLAGGIAHDFNNILTSILGNAEFALSEMEKGSPAHSSIETIELSGRRAAELTAQMLAYSGRAKFQFRTIKIADEVTELISLLQASISKKCTVTCNFADNLPLIHGDVSQIRQVIMNLIVNASEAIGNNRGEITVTAGTTHWDQATRTENYFEEQLPEGRYVFLEVRDTGSGMTEEVRTKLFDPFFTTKFTGRGLGLAAVTGIVKGHRGAIQVLSEPGRGATFRVLFPVADSILVQHKQSLPASTGVFPCKGTVLVVDDEEQILLLVKKVLERAGFRVMTAADGMHGTQTYREHADEIDVVLLDMTMPDMDGAEVFREIRSMGSHAKVLLCSGFSEEDSLGRFGEDGLAGFVQKPYHIKDLPELIRNAMAPTGPSCETHD